MRPEPAQGAGEVETVPLPEGDDLARGEAPVQHFADHPEGEGTGAAPAMGDDGAAGLADRAAAAVK